MFPGRKLHSDSAGRRARDRMLVELFNKVVMPQMRIWFGVKKGLRPARLDYMIWPWIESIDSYLVHSKVS